ncbi:sodium:calcium antiporter [Anaerobacillus sp. MEB173]|uniref:sodium:calcium antiporter n=1 Tax=Anaerobacillus sp. MEB173 TaxID=3383345 RepID=UPI003F93A332
MVFILFIIAAVITVFVAIKLSTYADVISEKTAVGGMLIGAMLLAGATSLPEITTSYTSIMLDSPDLAVGNLIGSNMFNLLILAALDLYFRKEQVYDKVWIQHRYTAIIGIALSALILFSLRNAPMYSYLGIGLDTFLMLLIYIAGMALLSRYTQSPNKKVTNSATEKTEPESPITVKRAMIGFAISAIIILASGTTLTIAGDQIAIITGIGASFVGSFLIALSTSLPEAVACFVAFRIRNFNLAIGSILGSNLFNVLILAGTDIFYRPGAILSIVQPVHQITAALVIVLYSITFFSLTQVQVLRPRLYFIPSTLVVALYLVSSYFIFIYT